MEARTRSEPRWCRWRWARTSQNQSPVRVRSRAGSDTDLCSLLVALAKKNHPPRSPPGASRVPVPPVPPMPPSQVAMGPPRRGHQHPSPTGFGPRCPHHPLGGFHPAMGKGLCCPQGRLTLGGVPMGASMRDLGDGGAHLMRPSSRRRSCESRRSTSAMARRSSSVRKLRSSSASAPSSSAMGAGSTPGCGVRLRGGGGQGSACRGGLSGAGRGAAGWR